MVAPSSELAKASSEHTLIDSWFVPLPEHNRSPCHLWGWNALESKNVMTALEAGELTRILFVVFYHFISFCSLLPHIFLAQQSPSLTSVHFPPACPLPLGYLPLFLRLLCFLFLSSPSSLAPTTSHPFPYLHQFPVSVSLPSPSRLLITPAPC